jgi:hypothetical protein
MAGDRSSGLANLEPTEPGNSRAVTHGAHSERLIGPVAVDVAEEVEQLCSGTPAGEGQFAAARAVLARKLARLRMVGEYLEANHDGSPLTHKGGVLKVSPVRTDLARQCREVAQRPRSQPVCCGQAGSGVGP